MHSFLVMKAFSGKHILLQPAFFHAHDAQMHTCVGKNTKPSWVQNFRSPLNKISELTIYKIEQLPDCFQPLIFSVLNLQKISSLLELLISTKCVVLKSELSQNF